MKLNVWRGPERPSPTRIFLATPAYSDVTVGYAISLFHAAHALESAGIGYELAINSGNCHVDDSRNALVQQFLKSNCSSLVFLDSDLRFSGDDLVRLVNYEKAVVAGVYPKKRDGEDYPVWLPQGELWADEDNLLEVLAVPTGFLKISREAIEKICKIIPHYYLGPNQKSTPLIFERSLDGATRVGGDYEFCRKWRSLGGKLYVDPRFEFGHIGDSEWSGSLKSWLLRKNGKTDSYIAEMLAQLSKGQDIDFNILYREWGNEWAASPEFLAAMSMLAQETKGPVLECGSGLSTLVLGVVTTQPVYVLEEDMEWAKKTQEWIERMKWNHVYLFHAPIYQYKDFKWYELPENLPTFNLAVVDGPRSAIGRDGFYSLIKDFLAPCCKIIADDDITEEKTIKNWGLKYHLLGQHKQFAIAETNYDCQTAN